MIPLPFSLPIPAASSEEEADTTAGTPPETGPALPTAPENQVLPESQMNTPFVVEHVSLPPRPGHHNSTHFTPAARVLVTPTLRTSGLLALLSDEAARTLLAMLTFVTPNGRIQPTTLELAEALKLPEPQARERLNRLATVTWRGTPLAHTMVSETGRVTGVLSRTVISTMEAVTAAEDPWNPVPSATILATIPAAETGPTWREQVIERSRSRYATPRAEAERLVAEQLRHAGENNGTPEGEARRKLWAFGISAEQSEALLSTYPLDRIERQISWMGMRQARNPARFLAAAIAHDYDPPEFVRRQQAQERARLEETGEQVPDSSGDHGK